MFFFALLLALLIRQTLAGEIRLPLPIWPVLFIALVAFQLVPLPADLLGKLSPPRMADLAMNPGTTWAAISVYPRENWLGLVKFLAYLSAFVLAAHVSDLRKNRSILVRVLIITGLVEAAYGIVQYLTGWQQIFTYIKKYNLEEATGTFINRNHFAGHLEMVIPFVLASVFYAFDKWASRRHAYRDSLESEERTSAAQEAVFYLFLLVLIVVALIFSRSRMGILVTLLVLVFIAGLAHLKSQAEGLAAGDPWLSRCRRGLRPVDRPGPGAGPVRKVHGSGVLEYRGPPFNLGRHLTPDWRLPPAWDRDGDVSCGLSPVSDFCGQ